MGSTWILIVLSTKFRLEFCQWPPCLTVCQWLPHLLSLLLPFLLLPFISPLNSASLIFVENWECAATHSLLKFAFSTPALAQPSWSPSWFVECLVQSFQIFLAYLAVCFVCFIHSCWMRRDLPKPAPALFKPEHSILQPMSKISLSGVK